MNDPRHDPRHDPDHELGPELSPELEAELAATDAGLQESLAQLLRSPADLETRTRHQVSSSLISRSLLGTCSELLTVGWETMRFLVTEPTEEQEEVSRS
ncbi:MAG: hypothetical protein U0Q22_07170 [Acidimicrobiales bacterium]